MFTLEKASKVKFHVICVNWAKVTAPGSETLILYTYKE